MGKKERKNFKVVLHYVVNLRPSWWPSWSVHEPGVGVVTIPERDLVPKIHQDRKAWTTHRNPR